MGEQLQRGNVGVAIDDAAHRLGTRLGGDPGPFLRARHESESTICTADSRSEVPVCITRLATLPAKSFWKKLRLCRTT
ncbi:hypothetical protein G6F64_014374 [Rhizopus arrhizus]|uniref:Uncharacterized protein n=1 Tax=Rhizopus oryzae TaxID=64495 RepID=A0A9P7BJ13_RHIOR|nr:hypothetical protein G6F64_014374 [Rhizopus arrhizus]